MALLATLAMWTFNKKHTDKHRQNTVYKALSVPDASTQGRPNSEGGQEAKVSKTNPENLTPQNHHKAHNCRRGKISIPQAQFCTLHVRPVKQKEPQGPTLNSNRQP
jgi:hypothetical protein